MSSDDHQPPAPAPLDRVSLALLADMARICYEDRRLRTRHLPGRLFAEPAWDILLEAFLCDGKGHPLTVSSACVAADVPASTALRHLRLLEAHDLIERQASSDDRRVVMLALTHAGRARMADYLLVLAKRRMSAAASGKCSPS